MKQETIGNKQFNRKEKNYYIAIAKSILIYHKNGLNYNNEFHK